MNSQTFICLINNTETFNRETWRNGVMVSSINTNLLLTKSFDGHRNIDFRLSDGRWESGKIHFGTKDAMNKQGE